MDKTEFIYWGNQSSTFSRKSPHEFFCPTDTVICRECEPSAVLACYLHRQQTTEQKHNTLRNTVTYSSIHQQSLC